MGAEPDSRRGVVALAAIAGAVGLAALVIALFLGGGAWTPPDNGLGDTGALVGWGLPISRLAALLAGITVTGLLLSAALLDPQGRGGVLSPVGRRDVVRASVLAGVWALSSLVTAAMALATILGLPLSEALSADSVTTFAWDVPIVRAYLLAALIAVVIGVGALFTSSAGASGAWLLLALLGLSLPALAGHAAGLGDHTLALSAGALHVISISAWVGGLIALTWHAVADEPGLAAAVKRFSPIAVTALIVVVLTGLANTYTRLTGPADLFTTGYGQLVLIKIALVAVIAVIASRLRAQIGTSAGGERKAFAKYAITELLLMVVASGVAVALTSTAYPRVEQQFSTPGETLLGRPFPEPVSIGRVLVGWQPDAFFLTLCALGIGIYLVGVRRLRARGDSWPWGRTACWVLGWLVVLWTTCGGIAQYTSVLFSMHMLAHMTLSMLAPILLVLGAPFTLALRALPVAKDGRKGAREWLVWALHSPYAKFITNPIVVLVIFTLGLYGLYYTTLFSTLMGNHLGHVFMMGHFLIAGYLFAWVIIGVDPLPKPLPYWGRLLLLMIALVIHSFFAVPIMMGSAAQTPEWYVAVRPPWLDDLAGDTRLAGMIAWGVSEIPTLLLLVVLGFQWAKDDERTAKRLDRKADRDGGAELAAYNEYLAQLNAGASGRRGAGSGQRPGAS